MRSWLQASGFGLRSVRGSRLIAVGLSVLLSAACGPEASPTTPTGPPTPGPGAGPAAQLSIVIDSLGSDEAITALSEVTLDATASTGSGSLTYRLDFGDVTSATGATARHIYNTPGSYTAAVTVTDAAGRMTTASRPVIVRSVAGAWLHAGYSAGAREVIVRRLSVTSQAGTTVRGFVGLPNQPDRPVTGELVPPRTLRLAFDDPAFGALEGVLPKTLGQRAPLELQALGGPANGERLAFRPAEGEPIGPPPDAVLNHRYFSFSAPFAIRGFSPMRFDGSGSRGDGLSYFIEFGDGQVSTESVAIHPIEERGSYRPRLTVIDRFGRADVEVGLILVSTLEDRPLTRWTVRDGPEPCYMRFDSQRGADVAGSMNCGSLQGTFSGLLSGERNIRLVVVPSGVLLAGTLQMRPSLDGDGWRMDLVQAGGAENGRTLLLWFLCGYTYCVP